MEIAKTELAAVEALFNRDNEVKELAELQMVLIGGGMGDVVFA
jgi:hypothetical protein